VGQDGIFLRIKETHWVHCRLRPQHAANPGRSGILYRVRVGRHSAQSRHVPVGQCVR
jgi:hypothetical protein